MTQQLEFATPLHDWVQPHLCQSVPITLELFKICIKRKIKVLRCIKWPTFKPHNKISFLLPLIISYFVLIPLSRSDLTTFVLSVLLFKKIMSK